MTTMVFDAVSEGRPGDAWRRRWERSWPAYEAWFIARGGDGGPDRRTCRAALAQHMPELLTTYDRLVVLAGGGDRAARFLSTWRPPVYLGGCSLAAVAEGSEVRLVRNYDLSPELNEGFMLRSAWTGREVMGMVEFLCGLSDGMNDAGLAVALAYGGRTETGPGFGITTILRYVLETCETVDEAMAVLTRVPSHMAYNVALADRAGRTASVELAPGGGAREVPHAIATNHQIGGPPPAQAAFTDTYNRHDHLRRLSVSPAELHRRFLEPPLRQTRFDSGFGTLFTAEYDPMRGAMRLIWPNTEWRQSFQTFHDGQRTIQLDAPARTRAQASRLLAHPIAQPDELDWSMAWRVDWIAVGRDFAAGNGREIPAYLAEIATRRDAGRPRCHHR